MKTFKESHDFFKRAKESDRMHKKYPTRICVIVEKARNAPKDTPDIDRKKYLVPRDISISQFMYVIRNRIHMPTEKSLFLFINYNSMPPTGAMIGSIYEEHKDADGFLYITYASESTFG